MSEEIVNDTEQNLYDDIKKTLHDEIKAEVRDELKKEFTRKGVSVPAVAKSDDGSFGDWLACVGQTARHETREKGFNTLANKYGFKAMSQGTTTAGGFLVPEIWANELLSVEGYPSVAYPGRVRTVSMATDVQHYPVLDQTVTPSNGSSAFNAGVAVAVVSEGSAPGAETKPAFKQLTLTASKVLAFTEVTNELIDNSAVAVQQIVTGGLQAAILDWIDYQVFNGSSLTAVIGHGSTINLSRSNSGKFELVDAAVMYSRLAPGSRNNAVWVIHPYHLQSLINFNDGANRIAWLPNQNAAGALQMTLFGLPVIPSQFLPGVGSQGDVCLVDLNKYVLGVNKNITIGASVDFKYTSDITVFRAVMRLAGKPMLTDPVLLADATSEVSPFITLDDVSS